MCGLCRLQTVHQSELKSRSEPHGRSRNSEHAEILGVSAWGNAQNGGSTSPSLGIAKRFRRGQRKPPLTSWQPRLLCTWSRWCCMEKVTPDQKIRAEQNSAACKVSMTAGISPDIESPSLQRRCGSRNRDIRFAIWAQYPKYLVFFVFGLFD